MTTDDDLRETARRWRAIHSAGLPTFGEVWSAADAAQRLDRRRHRFVPSPAGPLLAAASVVLVAGVAIGIAIAVVPGDDSQRGAGAPVGSAPETTTELSSCGGLPESTGPFADSVAVELVFPTEGRSGATMTSEVRIASTTTGSIAITDAAQPVDIVLTRDKQVVARSAPQRGTGWLATVDATGTSINAAPLGLVSCSRREQPLPAGTYEAYALFRPDERTDHYVVSPPQPVRVVAG